MKSCVKCGVSLQDNDQFCPNCGAQQVNPEMNAAGQNTQNQQFNQGQPYGQNQQFNQGQPYGQNQQFNQGQPYGQNQQFNQGQPYGQGYNPYPGYQNVYQPPKALAVIAYLLSWLGFVIALLAGDKNDPFLKHHLNQALVLHLFALLSAIPFVGWAWGVFILIDCIIGIVYACQGEMKEVPLLGQIHILQ